MKNFIEKILSNQQVTINELSSFIIEYADLCGIKNTNEQHVQAAIHLIVNGIIDPKTMQYIKFDIKYACKNYTKLKNIEIKRC
jgi:hypothetical protein